VQSRHPKAKPAPELRAAIDTFEAGEGRMVVAAPSMESAIETAQGITPEGGYIIGTGSVFVAAELREAWNGLHAGLFAADDWIHEANTDPPLAPLPRAYGTI